MGKVSLFIAWGVQLIVEFNKVSGRVDGVKAIRAFTSSPVGSYISITSGVLAPIFPSVSHLKLCLPSCQLLSGPLHFFSTSWPLAHTPPPTSLLNSSPPLSHPVISYRIKSTFDKYSSQSACVALIVWFSGMSQQLKVCMDVCVSMIASESMSMCVCVSVSVVLSGCVWDRGNWAQRVFCLWWQRGNWNLQIPLEKPFHTQCARVCICIFPSLSRLHICIATHSNKRRRENLN